MKKKIFRWVKVICLLYALTGIALYYLQDRLLFHPETVARNFVYDFGIPYKEMHLPYDAETNLDVIRFPAQGDTLAKGAVIYFHGNAQNITHYAPFARNFTSKGYEVWMLDYPGFGKSTGKFSEQRLYDYALQMYKLVRTHFSPHQIIIYGKSLGSGIASQLASIRNCRFLILESPYYSMTSLVRHYLPIYPVGSMLHYHFPTNEWMPKVDDPVVIFHGTTDGLIPFSNGSRLIPLLKPGDEFVAIPGGSHNDLNDFPLYHQKLDSLLEK